jgi:diguanylate cyclase
VTESATYAFMAFANGTQGVLVALAAWSTALVHRRLDPDNPARTPWLLISAGFAAFAAGESVDAYYELVGRNRPFPSALDAVFLAAYVLIGLAFVCFVRTYLRSELAGDAGRHRTPTLVFGAVLAAAGVAIGYLLLSGAGPLPERLVSTAYPVLDLLALVPAFLLMRITLEFRGGALWRVWAAILAGFALTCAADFVFAYFTVRGIEGQDVLMEALYLFAYAAFLRGSRVQAALLAS